MKIASLLLLTSVGLLLVPVLVLDGTPKPPPAAHAPTVPLTPERAPPRPMPEDTFRPPVYAIVPLSGREVVEGALAPDAGRSEPLPRERQPLLDRAPERQARGLSGSA